MNRYQSGSKKRKALEAKKRKEENLLSKVPKISSIFSSSTSSISTDSDFDVSVVDRSAISEVEGQIEELMQHEEEDIGIHEEIGEIGETESIEIEIPTDPAAWCMDRDVNYLQSYWAKHGSFQFLINISCKLIKYDF